MLRALVPLFTALGFFVVERRLLSVLQTIALSLTTVGAVLAVAAHSVSWKMDGIGLATCLIANVASALQLSLTSMVRELSPGDCSRLPRCHLF